MTVDAASEGPTARAAPTVLVIGVGNRFGGDDGFGLAVVDRVHQLCPETPTVEVDGEPARLVEAWDDADLVVLVDAVRSDAAPGTRHRLELVRGQDAAAPGAWGSMTSSHRAGVAEAWALGTALDRTPARLIVLGVEGDDYEPGCRLSGPVAEAVPLTARAVCEEIARAGITEPPTARAS